MRLDCPSCRTPLHAKDVRLDLALATCQACGEVHDLSGRKASASLSPAKPPRPRIKQPGRFRLETSDENTRISWRWLSPKHLFMILFCMAWDGFLVVWYGIALHVKDPPIPMLVFPLVHVAIGVGLTYSTLAGLLNRTRIEVSRHLLTIRHGPLPWKGNQTLNGRQLKQLYVEESVRSLKRNAQVGYHVMALDQGGNKVRLLSNLEDKDHALFLEQELERHLGIEDAPVRGALEA